MAAGKEMAGQFVGEDHGLSALPPDTPVNESYAPMHDGVQSHFRQSSAVSQFPPAALPPHAHSWDAEQPPHALPESKGGGSLLIIDLTLPFFSIALTD